jgi:hypothetical protein
MLTRGLRVGTIKHNMHGFEIDREKAKTVGAISTPGAVTVIASPHQVAVVEDADRDYGIGELRDRYIRRSMSSLLRDTRAIPIPRSRSSGHPSDRAASAALPTI